MCVLKLKFLSISTPRSLTELVISLAKCYMKCVMTRFLSLVKVIIFFTLANVEGESILSILFTPYSERV